MKIIIITAFLLSLLFAISGGLPSRMLGLWHCGSDGCLWAQQPDLSNSYWIINRGDGHPTANVVILSFVDPWALLMGTTNSDTLNGIPRGMTAGVVSYFKSQGIIVQFSIGGAAYAQKWTNALNQDPRTLARNAASMAQKFGVGVEIDYENTANLAALDTFARTYRTIIPNQNTPESLLTVDTGAGTGYLTEISKMASTWFTDNIINWENAMVAGGPYGSASTAEMYWTQHLQGANWDNLPPVKPQNLVGSLYSSDGSANCHSYSGTVFQAIIPWVQQQNMAGVFFWAAGCPGSANSCISNCTGIESGSRALLG